MALKNNIYEAFRCTGNNFQNQFKMLMAVFKLYSLNKKHAKYHLRDLVRGGEV